MICANCNKQTAICRLQCANCNMQTAICKLQYANWNMQTARFSFIFNLRLDFWFWNPHKFDIGFQIQFQIQFQIGFQIQIEIQANCNMQTEISKLPDSASHSIWDWIIDSGIHTNLIMGSRFSSRFNSTLSFRFKFKIMQTAICRLKVKTAIFKL